MYTWILLAYTPVIIYGFDDVNMRQWNSNRFTNIEFLPNVAFPVAAENTNIPLIKYR